MILTYSFSPKIQICTDTPKDFAECLRSYADDFDEISKIKDLKKKSKESPEYKKIKCAIGCKVVPIQKNVSLKLQRDNGVIDSLSSYLPNFVKRHIKSRLQFIPNGEPFSQKLSASILFIDISGFTSLNEQLAKLGPAGPEAVSKHINNYFSKIIDVVHKFGGDILKFAGKQFFIFLTFFFLKYFILIFTHFSN